MCGSCVLALTSQFTLLRNNRSHEDRGARFGKLTNVVVSRNVVGKIFIVRAPFDRVVSPVLERQNRKNTCVFASLAITTDDANHRRAHDNDQRSRYLISTTPLRAKEKHSLWQIKHWVMHFVFRTPMTTLDRAVLFAACAGWHSPQALAGCANGSRRCQHVHRGQRQHNHKGEGPQSF